MKKEFEKTSKNPIKESSKTEQKNTEDVKQGTKEEFEKNEAFYRRKAAARIDARAEKLHSLVIRAMPKFFWPVSVLIVVIISLAILVGFGIRVLHFFGPECLIWLGEEKLSDIDKILGAVLAGGLLGSRLQILSNQIQKIFSEKSS